MTTALTTRHTGLVGPDQWTIMRDQAAILVKSGLLPSTVNTPEKAVAIMLKGSELGIPPMYALSNIVVIQGKPTANAELMLALIYRDHGDGAIQFARSDNATCTVSYSRRTWTERQTFSFSLDDAKQAGLLSNATWQKYPAAMLRARAISAVARMAFPDSIGGMYTPEELGAAVAVNGDTGEIVIDAQEVPAESTPGRAVAVGERRA
ncbi:MAG TPA: recombinase RecT, partial [Chloroflexia bacterium]